MPHTSKNNYKRKWQRLKSAINSSVAEVEDRGAYAERVIRETAGLEASTGLLSGINVVLHTELSDCIETMNMYAADGDVEFDAIRYTGCSSLIGSVKTAISVLGVMKDRLAIMYEASAEKNEALNIANAALERVGNSATNIREAATLISKPGDPSEGIPARDPNNMAGVKIAGKRVRFTPLTPTPEGNNYGVEFLDPVSPPVTLSSPPSPATRGRAQSVQPRSETVGHTGAKPELRDKPVSPSPSPSRRRRPTVRPGSSRVLTRPGNVINIPLSRPPEGWARSLPGEDSINWRQMRKELEEEDRLAVRGLSDTELYHIMIGTKEMTRDTEMGSKIRAIL